LSYGHHFSPMHERPVLARAVFNRALAVICQSLTTRRPRKKPRAGAGAPSGERVSVSSRMHSRRGRQRSVRDRPAHRRREPGNNIPGQAGSTPPAVRSNTLARGHSKPAVHSSGVHIRIRRDSRKSQSAAQPGLKTRGDRMTRLREELFSWMASQIMTQIPEDYSCVARGARKCAFIHGSAGSFGSDPALA